MAFSTKLLIFLSGVNLVQSSSSLICNADNCLRQLRHGSPQASPFCSTYLGNLQYPPIIAAPTFTSTITVEPVVYTIGGGGGYVTMHDAPLSTRQLIYKRDVGPEPTPTATLELRQTGSLPTFASSCTPADPTRLSSGCSCLIGISLQTTTTYVAKTISTPPLATVTVCTAGNNYGLSPVGGFDPAPNPMFSTSIQPTITDPQSCCSLCFQTPGCAAFYLDPNSTFCTLKILTGQIPERETPGDNVCPAGLIEDYQPYGNDFGTDFGLGPCGYLEYSDE